MGLLQNTESVYYSREKNSGSYQFISLDDIINNFIISYVGQDKIIPKIKKGDVQFHAMRSVQELSFDTFKSVKSQELTVPPSLKLMLPQDYVNYTNISWVDSSGAQHTIHPTNKTSNPQKKGNLINNSSLNENANGFTFSNSTFTFDNTTISSGAIRATNSPLLSKIKIPVSVLQGNSYTLTFKILDPEPTSIPPALPVLTTGDLNVTLYGNQGFKADLGAVYFSGQGVKTVTLNLNNSNINFSSTADIDTKTLVIEPGSTAFDGIIDDIVLIETSTSRSVISKSWNNFKSTSSTNHEDHGHGHEHNYGLGARYGIDPQYAQGNGSFFIDNDILHLGAGLNGKTLVLKYISDGLATDEEMIVHKFAEEAMYKCIAYAVISTRKNTPEYIVQRFRKEKIASTRKAKLRLSNIKLEELTQILRGKSKQIKH